MIHKPNFFVLTGGPGVGKTTLIRRLAAMGELVVEETARAVIREQVESGGDGVPWRDNDLYVQLCAERDIAIFDGLSSEPRRVFFDRGIIDSYRANGSAPSPALLEAIRTRRYNRKVFLFPPWREIYDTDDERRQAWPEAERTFDLIRQALAELDYEAVVTPRDSVERRASFVLRAAADAG
ncbi:AAA family ATPase [Phenylobacterium sp.]|uniref:AAA family ATPase n=1 Tax=Phenylobacterium sp. TaxID=1871053 RepID=UPI0025FD7E05|nr:AAA family ATPase [Phenylobacterium sp.]